MSTTTTLTAGQKFTATVTGTLRGQRFFRERTFVASRDQEVEVFIRGEGRIDQDRVFVRQATRHAELPWISVPELIVAGTIITKEEVA